MAREKALQERVDEFQKLNDNIDIISLVKERNEFKNLYQQELRKYNQARIVLESQNRLINSPKLIISSNPASPIPMSYAAPITSNIS